LPLEDIEIFEHETKHNTKIKEEQLSVRDKIILEKLDAENKISVSYGSKPEHFLLISTNSHIGSLTLEDAGSRINILPKIFKDNVQKWENLNLFLDYSSENSFDYVDDAKNFYEGDDSPTLLNPIHNALLQEYQKLLKQGLLKSYVVHSEDTSSLRGKLLLQYQMLNDATSTPKFVCEFDELEYDSLENRVILQALTIVERTSSNSRVKMMAMELAKQLSGSVTKITTPKPQRQRMMQSYNRQNLRYRRIHSICEKVIEESGIKDIYRGDHSYVSPVFYDMNELFENFIQNLFQKVFGNAVKIQHGEVSWKGDGDLGPRKMKPDITMWNGKTCEEIIDVKYKTKNISSGDLYQLGFYMHEFGKENPDGKPIKHAFAITPKFEGAKSGTYKSTKTERKVYVKRIDVEQCLGFLKTPSDDLKREVKSWIEPIE